MYLFENQIAFFFKDLKIIDYEKFAYIIRENFAQININFVSPAMILPIPIDAPAEIPRLQMSTPDQTLKINMSPLRADLIFTENQKNKIDNDLFFNLFLKLSEILLKNSLQVIRLGTVSRYILDDKNSAKRIMDHIFKFSDPDIFEASVRFVKKSLHEHFTINDSYAFETGFKNINNQSSEIVLITRDINTPADQVILFDMNKIKQFKSLIQEEMTIDKVQKYIGE